MDVIKFQRIYAKYKHFFSLTILTVCTLLTYYHRLGMYFWYDDYTLMYYSQAKIPIPYPYGPTVYLFDFFKQFFGMNYFGYAIVNIIFIVFAVYLLYFLSLKLFKNNIFALFAALTLTNGYVGQEEIKVFISLGLTTVIALNLFIITLICFLLYLQNKSSVKLLIFTYIMFFFTIEIGALRYPFIFLVFILIDWLYSYSFVKIYKGILVRNIMFLSIFLIQYIFKPSALFFHYSIMYEKETSLNYIQMFNYNLTVPLLNTIGSFWNILFPRFFQIKIYLIFKELSLFLPNQEIIFSVIPVFIFFASMLILVKFLRKNISWFKINFFIVSILIITIILLYFINVPDPPDKISIISGWICLMFLIALLILKIPSSFFIPGFSLILMTNFLTYIYTGKINDYVFDSTYRYLFTNSLITAFITSFLISKEMLIKNKKKFLAWIIYLIPTSLLIILPFIAGYFTLSTFVNNYGTRPIKLFKELKTYIPIIEEKTLIHLEGDNPDLQKLVSDSIIAGTFPSERVFAIHYNTDEHKFVSLENLDDLPTLLKKDRELKLENIYSFIYSEDGLHDVSPSLRELIKGKTGQIYIKPSLWMTDPKEAKIFQNDYIVSSKATSNTRMILYLNQSVKSQLQIQVRLKIKAKTMNLLKDQGKILISWSYDIFTPHKIDQEKFINVNLDDQWHEYQFKIPAYGRYLDTLKIELISFNGMISLTDMFIDYSQ